MAVPQGGGAGVDIDAEKMDRVSEAPRGMHMDCSKAVVGGLLCGQAKDNCAVDAVDTKDGVALHHSYET